MHVTTGRLGHFAFRTKIKTKFLFGSANQPLAASFAIMPSLVSMLHTVMTVQKKHLETIKSYDGIKQLAS